MLCDEVDIVTVMNVGKFRWLGQVCGTQELDPCRELA